MTLAPTGQLIHEAVRAGQAVASFNVICLEHAEGIVAGAERAEAGVLLQVSQNAIRFHGGSPEPLLGACRALAETASVPIAIHLDHIVDPGLARRIIRIGRAGGVGSLMFDASALSYEENVSVTAEVTAVARAAGLWTEGELGEVGGKGGAHDPGVRTDPRQAQRFVASTGVDGLAVAVGSIHAMSQQTASIDLALVGRLAEAVPIPLVLHGSSGVPLDQIGQAIRAGIRKVNVGTALNVAFTAAVRASLDGDPSSIDPRPYLRAARDRIGDVVARYCDAMRQANQYD